MKITIVCPPFTLTGGHRVIATYAEKLQRRGHTVVVVAPPANELALRYKLRNLLLQGRWTRSNCHSPEFFKGLGANCRVLERYRSVTADDLPDADVLIATWWETAEWIASVPASKGAKVYFLQHYETFDFTPTGRVEATWRLPYHKIVVAEWLAEIARERYGDPDATVVPNAVDLDLFHAPPRGKNAVPTVGLMYSTLLTKRCDLGLRAFGLFAERHPGARLVAFGYQAPAPEYPLPPSAEFRFQPRQATLKELYARCDAWLFTSESEGFGLPILEAMACRTPVVGTPAGAAPELIGQGGGYLVRPGDAEDMADALGRLWALPDADWRAMSDAALETARRYNWDDAADRFEAALGLAVGGSKVAGH